MTEKEKKKFISDLNAHNCTEYYIRHLGIMITTGIQFLAETAGCWWLVDTVAANQFNPKVKNAEFQVYNLKVNPDQTARITIEDGNNNILDFQDLQFTDFPLEAMTIWCVGKVLILPHEY